MNDHVVNECGHSRTTRGVVYEHCEDCGAVRRLAKPGEPERLVWHSCKLCRLPGSRCVTAMERP